MTEISEPALTGPIFKMETSRMANSNSDTQKPVHEIRLGRIRASVWQNGKMYNTTFSRLYKDDNDKWTNSASFGRDDLPILAKVADRVHSWIFDNAVADS